MDISLNWTRCKGKWITSVMFELKNNQWPLSLQYKVTMLQMILGHYLFISYTEAWKNLPWCHMAHHELINATEYRVQHSDITWALRHLKLNHLQLDWLLSSLFRLTTKKTSKFHITVPLWGESTGDWWIPSQRPAMQEALPWYDVFMISSQYCSKWSFLMCSQEFLPITSQENLISV